MNEKSAYEEKTEAELKVISAKIYLMKAKAMKVDADARIRAEEQIGKFGRQKKEIQAKLDKLKTAGKEAFEQLKTGAEQAMTDLKNAVERAAAQFRE